MDLGYFQFWGNSEESHSKYHVQVLCEYKFSTFWGKYLKIGSLDHVANLCLY